MEPDAAQPPDVTALLIAWSNGDEQARDQLLPLVYDELREIAHRYLSRERRDHTLQTTALVHEAYLRLIDQRAVQWQNRAHFFGVAAQLMRRILIDYARSHQTAKRGQGAVKLSLDDAVNVADERAGVLLAVDEALDRLAQFDQTKSRVVELKFFGGLTVEETAEALGLSVPTIVRQWRLAKAWLYQELSKEVA
jgi:RNA polymerase sigma factor (TIGR02999 family)